MPASRVATVLGTLALAGAAQGAFDLTMYNASLNLGTMATEIASLDINSTAYNFPFFSGTNSGYVDEGPIVPLDRTQLVTRVYRVTQQTVVTQGADSITLEVGDNIYAYSIRLVNESANTVQSMSQFQVTGQAPLPPGFSSDLMAAGLLKGRGFLSGSPAVGPVEFATDLKDLGANGGRLDFQWATGAANHLDNGQSITLLVFTSPTLVGSGYGNFTAPPVNVSIDPNAMFAPILIPIVPSPGALALVGAAGLVAARRRR